MGELGSVFKRPTVEAKLIELVLGIACAAIVADKPAAMTTSGVYVVLVAIHGYLAINIISFLSYVMKTHLHKYINIAIALSGAAMYFAAGGLMIDAYTSTGSFLNYLMSAGVVALINGGCYLADAILSFREDLASS